MIMPVRDRSEVGQARRAAAEFARGIKLSESDVGRIALVATEMANNLIKHGGGGDIALERFADADGGGVELLALDKGRGIADVQRCLEDGYSTAGSPGNGLGAILRQSDRFAVFSRPGAGTVVMARFIVQKGQGRANLGALTAPYPGETMCGDAWSMRDGPRGDTLLMVDGLGHGPHAARAAAVAVEAFAANADRDCVALVEAIHDALAPTRGAAIAVARVDAAARQVRFVGIGNITGALVTADGTRRMISHNGTAGHLAPRIREYTYPCTARPLVLLHSDGISGRWDLGAYPGLASSHPSLVASVLFRDQRRGRDDASIVAMRPAS